MNYGFVRSKILSTDPVWDSVPNSGLPAEYSYKRLMRGALDQGSMPYCVPYSLQGCMEVRSALVKTDYELNARKLYSDVSKGASGMSIRDALVAMHAKSYMVHKDTPGVISGFALLKSAASQCRSLLVNGPFIMGLPVCDSSRDDFWVGSATGEGHAVCVIGYNSEGFEFRNSWGPSYGNNGFGFIPFGDIPLMLESWTIIW